MSTYNSYNSLKDNILKTYDIIDFGFPNCTYRVCMNFLENISTNPKVHNDRIFELLNVDKVTLAQKCYSKVVNFYKHEKYFPECEERDTNNISLTNIVLELFKIKEGFYKDLWTD